MVERFFITDRFDYKVATKINSIYEFIERKKEIKSS